MLLAHCVVIAAARALVKAGSSIEIKSAIIPITTNSSTSVKAEALRMIRDFDETTETKEVCPRSGFGRRGSNILIEISCFYLAQEAVEAIAGQLSFISQNCNMQIPHCRISIHQR